jgi:hypothetical protein
MMSRFGLDSSAAFQCCPVYPVDDPADNPADDPVDKPVDVKNQKVKRSEMRNQNQDVERASKVVKREID